MRYIWVLWFEVKKFFIRLKSGGKINIEGICYNKHGSKIECQSDAKMVIQNNVTLNEGAFVAAHGHGIVNLGRGVYVNRNSIIVAHENITIMDGVTIGPNCCIYDHDHNSLEPGKFSTQKIVIEKNAWIGAGVIILKGVNIGEKAIVGAGCVVTHDVPAGTTLIQHRDSKYIQ